jgi:hypothetical protein
VSLNPMCCEASGVNRAVVAVRQACLSPGVWEAWRVTRGVADSVPGLSVGAAVFVFLVEQLA